MGVFVRLVPALVFKTSGGSEQGSQWVRFPYTPVWRVVLKTENAKRKRGSGLPIPVSFSSRAKTQFFLAGAFSLASFASSAFGWALGGKTTLASLITSFNSSTAFWASALVSKPTGDPARYLFSLLRTEIRNLPSLPSWFWMTPVPFLAVDFFSWALVARGASAQSCQGIRIAYSCRSWEDGTSQGGLVPCGRNTSCD